MIKYINIIICLFASVLICSSCKNNEIFDFPGDNQNKIYLKTLDNTVNGYDKLSVGVLRTTEKLFVDKYSLPVYSTKPANGDINVSLKIEKELVDDFNIDNGTEYPIFPLEAIEKINDNLLILANSMKSGSSFELTFNMEALESVNAGTYLLPITLSEVSGDAVISTNRNTVYLVINLSVDDNIYDVAPEDRGDLYSADRTNWSIETFNSEFSNGFSEMFDNLEFTGSSYRIEQEGGDAGFIIDMQENVKNVSGILEMFFWTTEAISKSEIYTSINNKDWIYQGKYEDPDYMSEIVFYTPVEARYIKIVVKDSERSMFQITEFNIYVKN